MTTKPPPVPPRPFRFTLAHYAAMSRRGDFDHKRVELIYGEIVEMSPVNWPHHLSVGLVSRALALAFPTGYFVDVQQAFPVPSEPVGSAPQPDVAVIPGTLEDYTDHPTVAALLVEVANATLFYDTTTKAELYATAGVAEYWVLDIEHRQLIVFRDPHPLPLPTDLAATAYCTRLTFAPTERVSPLAAPDASVLVGDLLP